MTHIITIDGPAASGKGTLARRLAAHLNYFYLDTGKIYRLVGLRVEELGIIPEDNLHAVVQLAKDLAHHFTLDMLENPELKSDEAGQMASRCSQYPEVRSAVLDLQRSLANNPPMGLKGAVLDGRDCGTVICPNATHKFFIIADVEMRAKRRYEELQNLGEITNFEDVLSDMRARDNRDMNRVTAPLKPADDAMTIDTSKMNVDKVFEKVLGCL
jgi:cytidylate kinase